MTPEEVKSLHLDDVDNYQKRHLFLAERSPPRQIHRNLERSESRAVSPMALLGKTRRRRQPSRRMRCIQSRPLLKIHDVAKTFGRNAVLRDISLEIAEGEFLTILGESGSGKTTLLRIIAGFENATSGEIWMGGERLDYQPPYRRRVNTVFQHYALFPHLTVEQNVAYGLRVAKAPEAEIPHA